MMGCPSMRTLFLLPVLTLGLNGQPGPKWHTRDVTRLSQIQTKDYHKRSDVIFVAVGATEAQGRQPERPLPATAEQRAEWGKIGLQQLADVVKTMDLKNVVTALKEHAKFTEDVIVPKFKTMLPGQ